MRVIIPAIICILSLNQLRAQSGASALQNYMERVKSGSHDAIPLTLLEDQNDGMAFIKVLKPFLADSLDAVRSKAYYLLSQIGQTSKSDNDRKAAVSLLLEGIKDQNSGISGSVTNSLKEFKRSDFTNSNRVALERFLTPGNYHLEEVIRLSGYVGYIAYVDRLKHLLATEKVANNKWAARLALARMGEQSAIDYIINKISKAPINDDFVYDIVPDLIYTRSPEIFEFLETIINSDEGNCLSADPDASDNILCGYRVMEYLAPVIKDYPLPVDEFGSLEIDNYETALQDVRSWLKTNDYTIITETY